MFDLFEVVVDWLVVGVSEELIWVWLVWVVVGVLG